MSTYELTTFQRHIKVKWSKDTIFSYLPRKNL
jgi:hypothetical protein